MPTVAAGPSERLAEKSERSPTSSAVASTSTCEVRKKKRSSSTPLVEADQRFSASATAGSAQWMRALASSDAPIAFSERASSMQRFTSSRRLRTASHAARSGASTPAGVAAEGQSAPKIDLCPLSYGRFCQMSSARWGSTGASAAASASIVLARTVWHDRRRCSSAEAM
eukprot:scaffold67359_cov30-Tisochrysis_lutea.AAC.3